MNAVIEICYRALPTPAFQARERITETSLTPPKITRTCQAPVLRQYSNTNGIYLECSESGQVKPVDDDGYVDCIDPYSTRRLGDEVIGDETRINYVECSYYTNVIEPCSTA